MARPALAGATLLLGLGAALAQDASVDIELNKLEPQGEGCRTYIKVTNKGPAYQVFKLDLAMFGLDAVVQRNFAVDLGPLRADKQVIKPFDIKGTPCDQIGSFLINDVMECKTESGPATDCLKAISVSSRANVKLEK